MKLIINEIFYSLQGEGGRTGEASIFIRLSKCNLQCDFCDTEFESGTEMELDQILSDISAFPCPWIIWTGGEPCLQLTDEITSYFKGKGYKQAIESNGTYTFPRHLDYTVCSPKGNPDYAKIKNPIVDELRLPVKTGDAIPDIQRLPSATVYFLSPIFEPDPQQTQQNIQYCTEFILEHPQWKLSLQIHKLIGIR